MTERDVTRRLAAIVAADVAGYSRLIAADEEATLFALRAHRTELIDPKIAEYRGRVANTAGDSILIEFPSVVEALRCAMDLQRAMTERYAEVPEDRRIAFRIGINLGDVVEHDGDLLGDGVNVAARLEALAEPGGICLSRAARDQVRDRLELALEDLGEVEVKNIARPVRVFRVLLDEGARVAAPPARWRRLSRASAAWAAASLVLVIVAVAVLWWRPWAPEVEPARLDRMPFPLPEKPSIAVLPFDNLSGDPEQDYLADGMAEDIITALSSVPDLFVIARNSTFTYKGKPVKVQQVAEELGVRYVLEGSAQLSGDKIRVTAQLIDALSGHHLWSDRYDREMKELFALQDEITLKIARALQVELTLGEGTGEWSRGTHNLEAWALLQRATAAFLLFAKEDNTKARRLFRRAVELDPQYDYAWVALAWTHVIDARFRWSASPADSFKIARELAAKSLALNDRRAQPYSLLAFIALVGRKFDEAIALHERAVAVEPNDESAKSFFANTLIYAGRPQEGIGLMERAMRLSPYYPAHYLLWLGRAYRLAGREEESITALGHAKQRMPGNWLAPVELVVIYSEAGRQAEAEAEVAYILEIKPDATLRELAKLLLYKDRAERDRVLAALRKAGLPETPPLPLPDKPSIAVLPFDNMSGDPEQDYFADGMTEDIITDLSKISGLFVIARNSSFAYRGERTDVRAIARELGVRYLLEGSVRRAGDSVRINAQLIDAQSGGHLWAERYDGTLADVFELQDRVTAQIVTSLSVTLNAGEQALAEQAETSIPEAYDAFLTGWRHFRARTVEDYRTALIWLEKAVALDPDYGRAWAALASLYLESSQRDWLGALGLDSTRLPDLLDKALRRPTPLAYQVQAERLMMARHFDEAKAALDKASALDSNDPDTYVTRSNLVAMQGDTDGAIALMKTAMRLDPHYPAFNLYILGTHYLRAGDVAKAIELLERAQARNPEDWYHLLYLTAAYAEADRLDDAKEAAKALVERRKALGFPFTTVGGFSHWSVFADAFGERVLGALRKAGLPDQIRAEDLNLSPEYRLTGAALRETVYCGCRRKGRAEGGVWMRDIYPDGTGIHYWQGLQTSTTTSEIRNDIEYSERSNGRKTECSYYRNPKGTKENLDEFISVCAHGVFPFAELPLPETTR